MFCAHRFQVTGLIEGQWYAYRVRAFNKLGASRPCRATDEIQAVDARGKPDCGHPDPVGLELDWSLTGATFFPYLDIFIKWTLSERLTFSFFKLTQSYCQRPPTPEQQLPKKYLSVVQE